jgi:Zn-dependent protease/predicted transcriptional regulator
MTSAAPRAGRPQPRMSTGVGLGRIAGVRIEADWSLLVIFGLVLLQLGMGILPRWHPTWSPALVWSVALVAAVAFFASIVVHELSHALVAKLHGIPVRRITLFLFGGVAHLDREPSSPRAELTTAVIGPIVSLVIGVAATWLGWMLGGNASTMLADEPTLALSSLGPVATVLLWLGPVNITLAIFNMLPGFPLDGGRVLRAILWWASGDLVRATRWASTGGAIIGFALVALGLVSLINGNFGAGLWIALIGWFLAGAAREAYRQILVRRALDDVPLDLVMQPDVRTVAPEATIEELVHDHLMKSEQRAFPVIRDGILVGIVCMPDVRRVSRDAWSTARVADLMTPADKLVTLDLHAPASEALEKLAAHEFDQIPVVEGAKLRGLVRRRDLLKWLALRDPAIAD